MSTPIRERMKALFSPIKKITALGLLLLGLTLPACSASWLVDPVIRYFQKKTGLEIRIQEADWSFRPLRLTCKQIELTRQDPALQVRLSIDRLAVQFGWEFGDQPPFWPRMHIERLEASLPRGKIRFKGGVTRTDWRTFFKKIPAVHVLKVQRFSGEIETAGNVFHFPSGVDLSGSILPETGVRLAVKSGPAKVLSRELSVSAEGIRGEMEMIPAENPLSWKARVDLSRAEVRTPQFRLAGPAGGCSWRGRGKLIEISNLDGTLSGFQGIFQGFQVRGQGELRLRGTARWGTGERKEEIIPSLILALTASRVALEKGNEQINGLVSGELRVEGVMSRPRLSGKIRVAEVRGELPPFRWRDLGGVIPVQGTYPELVFTGVEVRAAEFVRQGQACPLRLTRPQADFSASILGGGQRLTIQDIRLSSREWGGLTGGLEFDRRRGAVPNGTADLSGFPLEKIINFFPLAGISVDKLKIPVQGRVAWQQEASRTPWEFRLDLEAQGLTQQWAGPRWGMEDLGGRFRARISWDPPRGAWSGEGTQIIDRGDLFGNPGRIRFNDYPLEIDWKGQFNVAEKSRVLEGQARVAFVPSGPWEVAGRLDWAAGDLKYETRVTAGQVPLATGYRFWRDQSGRESWVPEADLQGTVATAFTLVGNQRGGRLRGRVQGADLKAGGADSSWSLRLKQVDLPLRWTYGDPVLPEPDEVVAGRLEVEEVHTPWIRTRGLDIPVQARKNRVEIPGTITLPCGGGNLFLGNPVLSWSGKLPLLEAGLELKGLDLAVLLPTTPVAGSVQGDLGRIRLDTRRGEAPGRLGAAVFDGWVEARDLVVVEPFSPDRRLQAAVAFDFINLEKVTGLFSFGHISGYIQGRVDDLVLKGFIPERFQLTLKTREVEGAAKRINVQAVENVSLLGTGSGEPGGLQKGINRWFQDYAYQEIGLSCRLLDDTFTLRGTIFEGGTEYLVKSPGWYGIDVINQNPENEISFSDMLERLRRIGSKKDPGGNHDGQ
ncbi:MAG: hypothetical protein HY892_15965 [Deltaproteobacteria bacterium]|nr:hypothetical protein [Deltaproteobacteria bacterium]